MENLNPVSVKKYTVLELLDMHTNQLIQEDRLRYAAVFKELKTSLLGFNKHLNIYFSEIDVQWLKNYEMHLRQKKLGNNSISIRFRSLRTFYNMAIEQGSIKMEITLCFSKNPTVFLCSNREYLAYIEKSTLPNAKNN